MQSSMSGSGARIAIVCNITPAAAQFEETGNTLKFATRAKLVRLLDEDVTYHMPIVSSLNASKHDPTPLVPIHGFHHSVIASFSSWNKVRLCIGMNGGSMIELRRSDGMK
eukprot:1153081-Pelagomonas_calceolata.AAC.5